MQWQSWSIFLMIPSWRLDCSMTTEAPWDRLFRTLTWWNWAQDFCPKCAEAFVSCVHPHGCAQVLTYFFIHSSSSQSCIAIFYGTEYLWGRKIKNTVVLRAVLFSRWCSVQDEMNAWDKDLSTFWRKRGIVISFVLWPQRAEGVRLRCPQGVVLGQGICERLQEEQSELFLREEGEWAWDRSHYGVHTMVCRP